MTLRIETRRYDFDIERAVYLTVLHRLFASWSPFFRGGFKNVRATAGL